MKLERTWCVEVELTDVDGSRWSDGIVQRLFYFEISSSSGGAVRLYIGSD